MKALDVDFFSPVYVIKVGGWVGRFVGRLVVWLVRLVVGRLVFR